MTRTWRWSFQLMLVVGATLGLWGAPAWAVVEARPGQVEAGTGADVDFVVSQGCDSSPTTSVAILLPKEVSGTPQPVAGFGAAVAEGQAVRWTRGTLPANQTQAFRVHLRLPNAPGATLYFPVIQSCQQGEIRWIEVPSAGQDPRQLKRPAASLRLTAGPPAPNESRQPGPSQPAVPDVRSAGTRPKGGVPAGAGGTAGPTLAGLLAVAGVTLLLAGGLLLRLRQDG